MYIVLLVLSYNVASIYRRFFGVALHADQSFVFSFLFSGDMVNASHYYRPRAARLD